MKSKDQFFEKFGKKGGSLMLVAMLVVTAGTAATVANYFTSSGTANIQNQAISSDDSTSFNYGQVPAAPETFVDVVQIDNNNAQPYEEVGFKWDVQSPSEVTTSVVDVSEPVSVSTGKASEVGYDTSDNEVTVTVTNYDNDAVIGFDTDNDGTYDFQIDAVSSGQQPDYYGYTDDSTGRTDWTNSFDWTNNAEQEYRGVHFTDTGTQLQNKDSFTLTVDAERLGNQFTYAVETQSDYLDDLQTSSEAKQTGFGEDVTTTETYVAGDSSKNYVVVSEVETASEAGDYTATVDAVPLS